MGTKQYDSATDLLTFSRASSATFLGSNGLLQTAANNIPRIEYDATGAVKGLLIEEARTNLLSNSSVLGYSKIGTATSTSTVVSPSGLQDAVLVQPTVASGITWVYDLTVYNTGVVTTISTFAKASGKSFVTMSNSNGNVRYASFNLTTGAVGTVASGYTANIEDFGNGWYRCSVTTPTGFNDRAVYAVSDTDGGIAAAANGNDGILLYGAQAEAGAFPTSYIPTTGAAATRAADVATIPTSSFGFNSEGGTVVADFKMSFDGTNYARVWEIGSTIDNHDRINLFGNAPTGIIGTGVYTANVAQGGASASTGNTSPVGPLKVAFAWRENDLATVQDGGTVRTDSVATITGGNPRTVLALGVRYVGIQDFLNGHIKSIQYYPRRLTNAQLQELTT